MFLLALCKRSQANCFQMAACERYIIQLGEERERESSGGLPKAFCSTVEGISCLDLGRLTICSLVVCGGKGDWTLLASSLVCGTMFLQHTLKKLGFYFQGLSFFFLFLGF